VHRHDVRLSAVLADDLPHDLLGVRLGQGEMSIAGHRVNQ
jgi:hypothetical protein